MNRTERIKLLKSKIEKLKHFEENQNAIIADDLDIFVVEIKNLLIEKQRNRFNLIDLYEKKENLAENSLSFSPEDDIPF